MSKVIVIVDVDDDAAHRHMECALDDAAYRLVENILREATPLVKDFRITAVTERPCKKSNG